MNKLLFLFPILIAFKCAPAKQPEGSKMSSESSRNSGDATPTPLPTSGNQLPLIFGADAADAPTKATVHKCLNAGQVIDRKSQYTCLESGKPPLNVKLRSFADLKDPKKFPPNLLTQVQTWMARPEKSFSEQHFDYAVSCRTGVADNAICKDASGNKVENSTVLAFAKNDDKGSTVVSATIIQGQLFD